MNKSQHSNNEPASRLLSRIRSERAQRGAVKPPRQRKTQEASA